MGGAQGLFGGSNMFGFSGDPFTDPFGDVGRNMGAG